jgi:hypothetical protein
MTWFMSSFPTKHGRRQTRVLELLVWTICFFVISFWRSRNPSRMSRSKNLVCRSTLVNQTSDSAHLFNSRQSSKKCDNILSRSWIFAICIVLCMDHVWTMTFILNSCLRKFQSRLHTWTRSCWNIQLSIGLKPNDLWIVNRNHSCNLVSFKLIIWKPLFVNPYCLHYYSTLFESIITGQQEDKVNSVDLDWRQHFWKEASFLF